MAPPIFDCYLQGLRILIDVLGSKHPRLVEAYVYQQRLNENINRANLYGDTAESKAERAEILAHCNQLSLAVMDKPFSDLYPRPDTPSADTPQPISDREAKLLLSTTLEKCNLEHFGETLRDLESRYKDGWISDENERLKLISQSLDDTFWRVKRVAYNQDWKREGWGKIHAEELSGNVLRVEFFNGRQVKDEWQSIGEVSFNQFATMIIRELENNQQLKYTEAELKMIDEILARYPVWQNEELTGDECRNIVDTVIAEHCQDVEREPVGSAVRITCFDTGGTEIGKLVVTADGEVRKKPNACLRGMAWSKNRYNDFEHIPPEELERDAKFSDLCKFLDWELNVKKVENLLGKRKRELANTTDPTQAKPNGKIKGVVVTSDHERHIAILPTATGETVQEVSLVTEFPQEAWDSAETEMPEQSRHTEIKHFDNGSIEKLRTLLNSLRERLLDSEFEMYSWILWSDTRLGISFTDLDTSEVCGKATAHKISDSQIRLEVWYYADIGSAKTIWQRLYKEMKIWGFVEAKPQTPPTFHPFRGNTYMGQQVVILTALPVEYKAVRAHLTNLQEITHPKGTVYEEGDFSTSSQSWKVGIVEIGAGNPRAALEAERAIQYFSPDVILFVGVAGGIKDVTLGDVVAATKIYEYESGKAGETYHPRPEVGISTYRLIQRARAEAKKDNWLKRISEPCNTTPRVRIGPIAAGESVVISTKSDTYKFIQAQYSDALAVEMEGFGVLNAVQANSGIEALVIRGISDLLEHKAEVDAQGFQGIAAQNASAFAFEVLATLVLPDRAPQKSFLTQLLDLKDKLEKQINELSYVVELHLDHPDDVQWCNATKRYLRRLDKLVPGDNWGARYDQIPWHPPDGPDENARKQQKIYTNACNNAKGVLRDALGVLQEKIDEIR